MVAVAMQRRTIFQLGKILLTKKPEIARELIAEFLPPVTQPLERDLSKIPAFFKAFCQLQKITQAEYIGALYSHSKKDVRRLFVAVIVVIYGKHRQFLTKHLADSMQQDRGNTCRMITEVDFRYKKIEEFRNEVDEIVRKLMTK